MKVLNGELLYCTVTIDVWIKDKLSPEQLKSIAQMDLAENMDELVEIGKAMAVQIEDEQFGQVFDIP